MYEFRVQFIYKDGQQSFMTVPADSMQQLEFVCRQMFGDMYKLEMLRAYDVFDNVVCKFSRYW